MADQKIKRLRARRWHKTNTLTVWLESSVHNAAHSNVFLVSLAEGEPPIGKIVGRMTRKDGDRRVRNPSRYAKIQMLWTYALIGEPVDQYTKLDSQAESIRGLIHAHERKVAGRG
jgi:hypothetical protein